MDSGKIVFGEMKRDKGHGKSPRQKAVRRARIAADLSGFELDELAGLARGTTANIENTREPTDKQLMAIGKALDLDWHVLSSDLVGNQTKEVDVKTTTALVYWGVVPRTGWTGSEGEPMKVFDVPGKFDPEVTRFVRVAGSDYDPRFVKGEILVFELDDSVRTGVPLVIAGEGRLEIGKSEDGSLKTWAGKDASAYAVVGFIVASREDDPAGLSL